jgi:hypothetical protein
MAVFSQREGISLFGAVPFHMIERIRCPSGIENEVLKQKDAKEASESRRSLCG